MIFNSASSSIKIYSKKQSVIRKNKKNANKKEIRCFANSNRDVKNYNNCFCENENGQTYAVNSDELNNKNLNQVTKQK